MTIADFPYFDGPPHARRLAAMFLPLITGLALAVVGAFGSYVSMGLPVRLLHFTANALLIGTLISGVSMLVRRYLFGGGAPPLWATIGIAIAMALPGAWIVHLLLRLWAPQVLPYVSYADLARQVLTINLFISTASWIIRREPSPVGAADSADVPVTSAPAAQGPSSFRLKLPIALRGAAILSLSAEDHYVRVRTDRGQALILMNLSHAIAALGTDSGVRIHRSHWVARQAAMGGRVSRLGIRIDDTAVLPISRSGRQLLRDLENAL